MTPEQLENVGRRLFGHRWQTPMAGALSVAVRTVQRWAAGQVDIPKGVAAAVTRLDGHDSWVVGTGAETGREFAVRTKYPRFIGRLAMDAEDFDVNGLTYECRSDVTLCEIIWIDTPPNETDMIRLFSELDAALESIALDDAETDH